LLAQKGYRPLYLTARPEWLSVNTHDWLAGKGFPPGIVHTTLTSAGASGDAAGTFKTADLKLLAAKGLTPSFGFGNTSTDADAYNGAGIKPLSNRIFYQFTDTAWKGRRIDDYGSLLAEFSTLPLVCR
jgi:phosphatidate phosphatase PAH1